MPQQAARFVSPPAPSWWSSKGHKVTNVSYDGDTGTLTLANSGIASLIVRKVSGPPDTEYLLKWRILHGAGPTDDLNDEVCGQMVMNENQFSRAFGLIHDPSGATALISAEDRDWARQYGAVDGSQGFFVRDRFYLNVPGPGTGSQGDPNISIFLTTEMFEKAILLLMFRM